MGEASELHGSASAADAERLSKGAQAELEEAQVQQEAAAWAQHLKELVNIEWREELLQARERLTEWPLSRLVSEGFTVADLRAEVCGSFFGKRCVRFTHSRGELLPACDFQRGDQLIVSRDDPLRSRVKAQVLSTSPEAITCVMRVLPAGEGPWRLDRGPNAVAYARTVEGLAGFEQGQGQAQVRRILLELGGPAPNAAPELRLEAAGANAGLDSAQQQALRLVERRRVGLIQGPPGCGKTHTSCALLKAAYRGQPLLAVADSNVAVDQLLKGLLALGVRAVRFGSPASVTREALLGATVESMLRSHPGSKTWHDLQEELGDLASHVDALKCQVQSMGLELDLGAVDAEVAAQLDRQAQSGSHVEPELLGDVVPEWDEIADQDALRSLAWNALQALRRLRGTIQASSTTADRSEPELRPSEAPERMPEQPLRDKLMRELVVAEQRLAEQSREFQELERTLVGEVFDGAEVVCATITGCGSAAFSGRRFDLILLDEASQATEPRAHSAVSRLSSDGRLVLVGDQRQLPPVCLSRRARDKGLGLSLFERLLCCPSLAPVMLAVQYRMHPLIRQWPSDMFYSSRLVDGVLPGQRRPLPGFRWPVAGGVAFVQAFGTEEPSPDGCSKLNYEECVLVCSLVRQLLRHVSPECVGVISPYRGQVRLLRQHLVGEVEVRTVDGFQGREKSVIVISCVRSNASGQVGFLSDPRRLNVALTRAQRGLIVVGNRKTLQHDQHWRSWFGFVDAHQLAVEALEVA